ncbi:choice-of-anchor B family protein [Paraglaciecola aestuariivivens]
MQYIMAVIMILSIAFSQGVQAHAEHDKARFVAANGTNSGSCSNRFRPCKSVSYAAQQANKGDTILVAQGRYAIESEQDLLYLTGEVVPVLGGFNQIDQYQNQNPDRYLTTISGVPLQYVNQLENQGFKVIRDSKGAAALSLASKGLSSGHLALMKQSQSNLACVDGQADGYECSNIDLLAHIPLDDFPSKPSSANDIWGFVDLNNQKEYAIIGLRNAIALVDVSEPSAPKITGSIDGLPTTWRDIKVYQFYHKPTLRWQAYAYVTSEEEEGLTILDLSIPDQGMTLVTQQTTDKSAHNIYISNLDYSLNIALPDQQPNVHIMGSNNFSGALRSYSLADPSQLTPTYSLTGASASDYSHDASSLNLTDERAQTDCQQTNQPSCLVILDFNEGSLRLWDHTDASQVTELGAGTYPNSAYTHSGWWSEDKQYVLVHDELDERNFGLNTTLNIFDISQLSNPSLVGTWTGSTQAIDHNGFVRGNRYYMSNYERGLTVLDISNPSNPLEVGFFDTYPVSNNTGFNGAWGVYPYLPSGHILVSDINSGLFILRDQSLNNDIGQVSFSHSSVTVKEGDTASITVNKTGNGATSLSYQIFPGSADLSDFSFNQHTLSWPANNNQPQTIDIATLVDDVDEITEDFYVRLFNPQNGATLAVPNIIKVQITDTLNQGKIVFTQAELEVKETDASLQVAVARQGGNDGEVEVNYQLHSASATVGQDIQDTSGKLVWANGDTSHKLIELHLIDDQEQESLESVNLSLTADNSQVLGDQVNLTINIRDDESNQAPAVSTTANFEVNTRQNVSLTASATDPEAKPLTYEWTQTSGTPVTINQANTLNANFTAPSAATRLIFNFTATDDFGLSNTATVTVSVVAPPTTDTVSRSGGSFAILMLGLAALCLIGSQNWRKLHQSNTLAE